MNLLENEAAGSVLSDQAVEVIDLMSGQPAQSSLPADLICAAATRALRDVSPTSVMSSPLNYGDNTVMFGLRVASFLMEYDHREHVEAANLVPTSGVSQSLDALCTMLCRPHSDRSNKFVFVEDATYYLAGGVFRDHGLDIRTVCTDKEGISTEDLRRQLQSLDASKKDDAATPWPVFLYIIPNFHNPTGRSLGEARKRELCALSSEFGLYIVADEVYNLLNYTEIVWSLLDTDVAELSKSYIRPTSLSALGAPYVISVSSFSKTLAPGLRVGWIEFPSTDLADDYRSLGFYCSGSSTSHFSSCIVISLIETRDPSSGHALLYTHISKLRSNYAEKYCMLVNSLREYSSSYLPPGAQNQLEFEGGRACSKPVGGYFLWVGLPEWARCDHTLLNLANVEYRLLFRLGSECAAQEGLHGRYIRLCFAKAPLDQLREGARRICMMLRSVYETRMR